MHLFWVWAKVAPPSLEYGKRGFNFYNSQGRGRISFDYVKEIILRQQYLADSLINSEKFIVTI